MERMKLSEAIRLGSMLRPQAIGGRRPVQVKGWRGWILGEHTTGTCVLAAAADAVGLKDWMDCVNYFPIAMHPVEHPIDGFPGRVYSIAYRLNDNHRWTRERIADWVESVEMAAESEVAKPAEVVACLQT